MEKKQSLLWFATESLFLSRGIGSSQHLSYKWITFWLSIERHYLMLRLKLKSSFQWFRVKCAHFNLKQLERHVFHLKCTHFTLKYTKQLISTQNCGIGDWRLSRKTYEMRAFHAFQADRKTSPSMVFVWFPCLIGWWSDTLDCGSSTPFTILTKVTGRRSGDAWETFMSGSSYRYIH